MHGSHALEPGVSLKEPGRHSEQVATPSAIEDRPRGQSRHVLAPEFSPPDRACKNGRVRVRERKESFSESQVRTGANHQSNAPDTRYLPSPGAEYLPAPQSWHEVDLTAAVKRPAPQ